MPVGSGASGNPGRMDARHAVAAVAHAPRGGEHSVVTPASTSTGSGAIQGTCGSAYGHVIEVSAGHVDAIPWLGNGES